MSFNLDNFYSIETNNVMEQTRFMNIDIISSETAMGDSLNRKDFLDKYLIVEN